MVYMSITASELGRRGAKATNKLLTPEKRRKASLKGWANRWKRLGITKKKK